MPAAPESGKKAGTRFRLRRRLLPPHFRSRVRPLPRRGRRLSFPARPLKIPVRNGKGLRGEKRQNEAPARRRPAVPKGKGFLTPSFSAVS
ncbi:MAG: hypothetical protein CW346_06115 [Bacillaceae bacterium]|nr:hypothetical protein [Bacillaceae bacterium]